MGSQSRLLYLLIALCTVVALVSAASPTSFCKCTCFTNSTIIALNSPTSVESERGLLARENIETRKSKRTCNDCNRQFCLGYNLPICKGATEEDVFTTCFQRDSAKDQAVVFIFIIATAGLLAYAAIRPWIDKWVQNARDRQAYMPVSNQGDQ
ncbi:hypothetical protein EJ05DRAFT_473627 [Pseudovirgaria hyperparasitica]|uniref:Uncharacterized protein n=1 Tax=Pseudovirgaria hyperparasitica TaxID=470096 RepID=A0A6A6WGI0_9PEZI|nr:uncharacterized protein EJ05DRAFT_473627 [Pseudovirgaria hyperparasitica]KAF2761066.1 hypothetical protein EJ05DRAFT_473627 [Pseudovirgaria hyperparasitica]